MLNPMTALQMRYRNMWIKKDERIAVEQINKADAAYVRTVSSTKVPIYGNLRINKKDDKVV